MIARLVLDSSVIYEGRALSSSDFIYVKAAIEAGWLELHIPEVVRAETQSAIERVVDKHARAIAAADSELQKLGARETARSAVTAEQRARALTKRATTALAEALQRAEAVIDPVPDVPHTAVIARMHAGQKPFRALNDAQAGTREIGYRDFLIWRGIVDLCTQYEDDDVIFVSDNKRDFFKDDDLHPELASDVPGNPPTAYRSIRQLVELYIKPKLDVVSLSATLLDTVSNQSIAESYISETLDEMLPLDDPIEVEFKFGVPVNEPYLRFADEITFESLEDAIQTSEGSFVAAVALSAQCDVEFYVELPDTYSHGDYLEFDWSPWNDYVALGAYVGQFELRGQLSFGLQGDRIRPTAFAMSSFTRLDSQ